MSFFMYLNYITSVMSNLCFVYLQFLEETKDKWVYIGVAQIQG